MNKKELTKSILVLLALGIVIGGTIVYKKQINRDIENIDLEGVDTNTIDEDTEEVKEEVKSETSTKTVLKDHTKESNEAFALGNAAMSNAKYDEALAHFNTALKHKSVDTTYARIFAAYSAKGEWSNALNAIDKAIELNPSFTEHWNSKLTVLDDKMTTSFDALKAVYEQGLTKVDSRTKVNLVTHFARIAENNQKYDEAVKAFTLAKELNSTNAKVYDTEITRLNTLK